jgi:hypothetical protein
MSSLTEVLAGRRALRTGTEALTAAAMAWLAPG